MFKIDIQYREVKQTSFSDLCICDFNMQINDISYYMYQDSIVNIHVANNTGTKV